MAEFSFLMCVFCEAKVPHTSSKRGGGLYQHLQLWHNITVKREVEDAVKRALIVEENLSRERGREAFSHQSPETAGHNLTGPISPAPTLGEGEHMARKKRRESEASEYHPPDGVDSDKKRPFSPRPAASVPVLRPSAPSFDQRRFLRELSRPGDVQEEQPGPLLTPPAPRVHVKRQGFVLPNVQKPKPTWPSAGSKGVFPRDDLLEELDAPPPSICEPEEKTVKRDEYSVSALGSKIEEGVISEHTLVDENMALESEDTIEVNNNVETHPKTKLSEDVNSCVSPKRGLIEASELKCGMCGSWFSHKGNLMRHMRLHSDQGPYNCPVEGCDMNFTMLRFLKGHIGLAHAAPKEGFLNENIRQAREIAREDYSEIQDPSHAEEQTQNKTENTKSEENMEVSEDLSSKGTSLKTGQATPFRCKKKGCDRKYVNRASLLRHHRLDHKKELPLMFNFKCKVPQCGAVFRKKGHLVAHWRRVHALKIEGVVPAKKGQLKAEDVSLSTSPKPTFNCKVPHCDSRFTYEGNLQRHMKAHEGNLFCCDVPPCDAKFTYEGNLVRHMREVHENNGSKPTFPCEVPHCGLSFVYRGSLLRHLRVVHGDTKPRNFPWWKENNFAFAEEIDIEIGDVEENHPFVRIDDNRTVKGGDILTKPSVNDVEAGVGCGHEGLPANGSKVVAVETSKDDILGKEDKP